MGVLATIEGPPRARGTGMRWIFAAAVLLAASPAVAIVDVTCPDGTRYIGDGKPPCATWCDDGKWVLPGETCPSTAAGSGLRSQEEVDEYVAKSARSSSREPSAGQGIGALIGAVVIVGGFFTILAVFARAEGNRRRARTEVAGREVPTYAMLCRNCETIDFPERTTPGSFLLEVILWLCFLLPGILYSLWRVSSRRNRCPACGSTELVPVTSPAAQKLLGRS